MLVLDACVFLLFLDDFCVCMYVFFFSFSLIFLLFFVWYVYLFY